ncbi:hypothetical protein N9V13_07345 [Betaproteobacteria bacterium]|nr:hypothetical protein [Betaproteobacteria bacterium]
MTSSIGLDIGGAHLKACLIKNDVILKLSKADLFKTPIWESQNTLVSTLKEIEKKWTMGENVHINIAMTAEMTDCFRHRREGVQKILSIIKNTFSCGKLKIYSTNGLKEFNVTFKNYKEIASSNWHATADSLSKIERNCFLIDIGSTTTDITPIRFGKILSPTSSTDFSRLQKGELVYLGVCRTSLSSIRRQLMFRSKMTNIMRENFASTADLFRLTKQLDPKYDLYPTLDGKNKKRLATQQRLARIIGLDINDVTVEELNALAQQIKQMFVSEIIENLKKVIFEYNMSSRMPIVITGSGKFLAVEIQDQLKCQTKIYSDLFAERIKIPQSKIDDVDSCATAFSLAISTYL